MNAIITILDDSGEEVLKDIQLEPTRTEKIYEPDIMSYRIFDEFRFTYNRIVPREYVENSQP